MDSSGVSGGAILASIIASASSLAGSAGAISNPGHDTLLANGGFWLDSLALLELLVGCEQAFAVCLDPGELTADHLKTVGSLATLIHSRLSRG